MPKSPYLHNPGRPSLNKDLQRKDSQIQTHSHEPLIRTIWNIYVIHQCSIFISSYHEELQVSALKCIIPRSTIMPKTDPYAIPHLESNISYKGSPPGPSMLPQAHTMRAPPNI